MHAYGMIYTYIGRLRDQDLETQIIEQDLTIIFCYKSFSSLRVANVNLPPMAYSTGNATSTCPQPRSHHFFRAGPHTRMKRLSLRNVVQKICIITMDFLLTLRKST